MPAPAQPAQPVQPVEQAEQAVRVVQEQAGLRRPEQEEPAELVVLSADGKPTVNH